jgi:hypothetical protein
VNIWRICICACAFPPTFAAATAYGAIQTDGSYSLQTGSEFGLAAGDYDVTVSATQLAPPSPENPEPQPKLRTPARYSDVDQTDVRFTVAAGSNTIDLTLIKAE